MFSNPPIFRKRGPSNNKLFRFGFKKPIPKYWKLSRAYIFLTSRTFPFSIDRPKKKKEKKNTAGNVRASLRPLSLVHRPGSAQCSIFIFFFSFLLAKAENSTKKTTDQKEILQICIIPVQEGIKKKKHTHKNSEL